MNNFEKRAADKSASAGGEWSALPAPPPFDTAPIDARIAHISTDDGSLLHLDLLLGQLLVTDANTDNPDQSPNAWQPFISAGAIAVGRPIVFRMATNHALITSKVRTIQWMGNAQEISVVDRSMMRLIGTPLVQRRRWWWQRA
jgi:hypothetical protein